MDHPRDVATSTDPAFAAADGHVRGLMWATLAAAISASLVAIAWLGQTRRRAAPSANGRGNGAGPMTLGGSVVAVADTAPGGGAEPAPSPPDPAIASLPNQPAAPCEDQIAALVAQLAVQAEETGRLRERLAAAELRAEAAEAAAREAERRCRAEAAVADRFVGLLEERLRAAEREAARLAVERTALGAEFARLWSARGERAGPGDDAH